MAHRRAVLAAVRAAGLPLAELEAERVAVLAVNTRERTATVQRYLAATQLRLPVLLDPRSEATRAWQVDAFPTTVLIDTAGRPRMVVTGAVDWTGTEAARWIDALRGKGRKAA